MYNEINNNLVYFIKVFQLRKWIPKFYLKSLLLKKSDLQRRKQGNILNIHVCKHTSDGDQNSNDVQKLYTYL